MRILLCRNKRCLTVDFYHHICIVCDYYISMGAFIFDEKTQGIIVPLHLEHSTFSTAFDLQPAGCRQQLLFASYISQCIVGN